MTQKGAKDGFNKFAAGKKHYGGGRAAPNIGPVKNILGYKKRDRKALVQAAAKARIGRK